MGSRPKKVGITGGIGAGKTIVSEIFAVLGIPIYNADNRAKWLMNNDQYLIADVIELFGEEAYKNGVLNNVWIGKQVFNNPEHLQSLNQLVHPAVARDYKHWHEKQSTPYTLKEAALLFESGSYQSLDKTLLVTAPENIRIERVLMRDKHRTEADVRAILKNQMPEEEKLKLADLVIINDESQSVIQQALEVHKYLLSE